MINEDFAENLFITTETRIRREIEREKSQKRNMRLIVDFDRPAEVVLNLSPPVPTKIGRLIRAAELISTYYGATMVLVGASQQ